MFSFLCSESWAARRAAAVLIVAVLAGGCGVSDPKSPQFVVAKGKGVKVTRAELDKVKNGFLAQRGMQKGQLPPEAEGKLEKQILEQLVTENLLLNLGGGLKVTDLDRQVDERVQQIRGRFPDEKAFNEQIGKMGLTMEKIREEVRRQFLIREVVKAKVAATPEPTPADIEKVYNENEKSLTVPPTVRVSHILIKVPPEATPEIKAAKRKAIEAARLRITKNKEDFAKVAKEVSEDPGSAAAGGDMPRGFSRGEMAPEFEKVAFTSKIGELSPVFETQHGFHFLKVTESKPERKTSLAEATPQIQRYLRDRQDAMARDVFFKQLMADAKVQYFLPKTESNAKLPSGATKIP